LVRALKAFGRLHEKIVTGTGVVGGLLVLVAGILVTYDVALRFIFNAPTSWVFNISIYICIWVGFLCFPYALQQGKHISVDIVVSRLAPQTRKILETVSLFISLFYVAIILKYSIDLTALHFSHSYKDVMLGIPLWVISVSIPIGAFFFCISVIKMIIENIISLRGENLKTGPGLVNRPSFYLPVIGVIFAFLIWSFSWSPLGSLIAMTFLLLTIGAPVGVSFGLPALFTLYFLMGEQGLTLMPQLMYFQVNNFILVAVPLFTFCGLAIAESGMAPALFKGIAKWLGFLPGSLGVTTVGSCALFAATTGSATIGSAVMSLACIPQLRKHGYPDTLSSGVVAMGGALGSLIPPSVAFLFYGMITGVSVGKLFMAGVVPGIILAIMYAIYVFFIRWKTAGRDVVETVSWKERITSTKPILGILAIPALIMGGIYSGIFTPTESAAVVTVYVIAYCFITKQTSLKGLLKIAAGSGALLGFLVLILSATAAITSVMVQTHLADTIGAFITEHGIGKWPVLVMIMTILLLLGMFMDGGSITLIMTPVLYPIIIGLGMDPIWFGVLFVINMEIAGVTPPNAMNIYIVQATSNIPSRTIIKGMLPFMAIAVGGLVLFALVPQLSLWLPSLLK
jgi:C4-dicarboxylate transporter DctM subunit